MPLASKPKPSRVKVRNIANACAARVCAPFRFGPDVHAPAFRSEAHRQSLAIASSRREKEDQAFIDSVSDWGDE